MSEATFEGKQLGPYNVGKLLGRGGMGEVYRAVDQSLDRVVALKVMLSDVARDPAFVGRFVREARSVAKLNHRNIVQVYAVAEYGGVYCIAMEFIDGVSVAESIRRKGRLEAGHALRYARQAAEALAEAHRANIVHRDIKPANLMIDGMDRVKVMDFGLAKQMTAGESAAVRQMTAGTPYYMAPEQFEGDFASPRSDLYGLGVVLYEMLAGKPPYDAKTLAALANLIRNEPFPDICGVRPDVIREVSRIIGRMTAKRPEARYASAETVVNDLRLAYELQQSNEYVADPFATTDAGGAPVLELTSSLPKTAAPPFAESAREAGFFVTAKQAWKLAAFVVGLNTAIWFAVVGAHGWRSTENRALELMKRGLPPVEALRDAVSAVQREPSDSNQEAVAEIRKRVEEDTETILASRTFQASAFAKAHADIEQAAAIDPDPELLGLRSRFQEEWLAYGFVLAAVRPQEESVVFRRKGAEDSEIILKKGELLDGRFALRQVLTTSAVLEDTKIGKNGENRIVTAILDRPLGEP